MPGADREMAFRCVPQSPAMPPMGGQGLRRVGRQQQHAYTPPPLRGHCRGRSRNARNRNSVGSCRWIVPARSGRARPDPCRRGDGDGWLERDDRVAAFVTRRPRRRLWRSTSTAPGSGLETPDHVRRWRDRDVALVHGGELTCGTGYTIGVDAFDRSDNHSTITSTTVSTSACPDATRSLAAERRAPGRGDGELGDARVVALVGQRRRRRVRALRLGRACRDGQRRERDAHGPRVRQRATWSRSTRPTRRGTARRAATSYLRTSACPTTNQPPSTPTGLKVTAATADRRHARLDGVHGRRRRRRLRALCRRQAHVGHHQTSADFAGLQCGTTYALGVDAFDGAGKRSTRRSSCPRRHRPASRAAAADDDGDADPDDRRTARRSRAPSTGAPSTTGTATRSADDPGTIEFLVDGKVMLTETEHAVR